jgi:colanic acid biosynthesis glycosyl transferase WcaI
MRILILGLNYLPESTSIGPYTGDLAEYLAGRGHSVQVVTGFPMAPYWRVWDGYRGKLFHRETIHGVPVQRCYLYVPREPRKSLNRILFDVSFTVSALAGAMTSGPCDLVLAISPPLQIGLTGWLVSQINGAPLFFHMQDIVPDTAIATGMLSERSLAVRIAHALERFIYRRARAVGVIADGFKRNLIAKGVPPDKIVLLPNYIDLDFMDQTPAGGNWRSQFGLEPDDFVVMYSGSISLKQGLETLVEAAALLTDQSQIKFVIVGDGPPLAELKQQAVKLGLEHMIFLPLQPRDQLPIQLKAADVLVITQRRAVMDAVFPGKLLYYMAAGRPLLASVNAESETGRFITQHSVGVVTPPEQAEALAQAILELRRGTSDCLGENARATVEKLFDKRVILPAFATEFISLSK